MLLSEQYYAFSVRRQKDLAGLIFDGSVLLNVAPSLTSQAREALCPFDQNQSREKAPKADVSFRHIKIWKI
jgi:hypothetical protein